MERQIHRNLQGLKTVPFKAETRATINNKTGRKKTAIRRTHRDYINNLTTEPLESKLVSNRQDKKQQKTPKLAVKTAPSLQ